MTGNQTQITSVIGATCAGSLAILPPFKVISVGSQDNPDIQRQISGKEEPVTDRYRLASEESVLKMVIKNPHMDDLIKWFLKEISGSSYLTMGSQEEH